MTRPVSGNQMRKLGQRLARSAEVSDADFELLTRIAEYYQGVTDKVTARLRDMGIENTTRSFKSTGMIAAKLRRTTLSLGDIQDLAGTRIVIDGGRLDQDRVVSRIMQAFSHCPKPPDKKDRREQGKDSYGYRAVHVVVFEDGSPMEIQVRTKLQDAWAQISEKLGDIWGRGLRYGEGPDMPDKPAWPGSTATRAEVARELQLMSEAIDETEMQQVRLAETREFVLSKDPGERGDMPEKLAAIAQTTDLLNDRLHQAVNTLLVNVSQLGGAQ